MNEYNAVAPSAFMSDFRIDRSAKEATDTFDQLGEFLCNIPADSKKESVSKGRAELFFDRQGIVYRVSQMSDGQVFH